MGLDRVAQETSPMVWGPPQVVNSNQIVPGHMASEAEMRQLLQRECDADLAYLFAESNLALKVQYDVVQAGYKAIKTLVGLEESRAAFRTAAIQEFNLDPGGAAGNRLQLATLVGVWETAREQQTREVQVRAEAKALRQPRPISSQENLAMRRVVENLHGKMQDYEVPSMSYLSDKLEELELNNPQASPLDEILSIDDGEEQAIVPAFDVAGRLTVVRRKLKVLMPTGPEDFRLRFKVESNLWMFLAAKCTNRDWLRDMTHGAWLKWVDYFLGREVLLLEVQNGSSLDLTTVVKPEWTILLSYEFKCRKRAFALVRETGVSLVQALVAVTKDGELKNLYFMSPLLLQRRPGNNKRQETDEAGPPQESKKARRLRLKGKGKGKGRESEPAGKGKGKGSGKGELLSKTPDGRLICFAYNSVEGCSRASCAMVHCCRKRGCQQEHPLHLHPRA